MSKKIITITLELEYASGAIQDDVADKNGRFSCGISILDNDENIQTLERQICDLYSSCFEWNSHGETLWFDKAKGASIKPKLIGLLDELRSRIAALGDGSFAIDDRTGLMLSTF
ncbi:MAG: RNA helicase [Bacilli bacterium]|jgi:hypothetical protein|nr:RNA helicase [Bacilli bacterium]MCH4210857.1 RNA helicase [Bacilli bacterium]MCH4228449.1 RNA helicase [Bacilli bacterium]